MTCGCSALETSQLLTGGGKKKSTLTKGKKRSTTKKSTLTKGKKSSSLTKDKKRSTTKKSTKKRMSGGGLSEYLTGTQIPLRVQSSPDWHMPGTSTSPPYAIDVGEAMQSYLFGRPTPNGKDFIVASGLVERSKNVIDMVGGATKGKKRILTKGKKGKKKDSVTKKKRSTRK